MPLRALGMWRGIRIAASMMRKRWAFLLSCSYGRADRGSFFSPSPKADDCAVEWDTHRHAWLDSLAPGGLADAAEFVRRVRQRAGLGLAKLDDTAPVRGFMSASAFERTASRLGASDHARYLRHVLEQGGITPDAVASGSPSDADPHPSVQ